MYFIDGLVAYWEAMRLSAVGIIMVVGLTALPFYGETKWEQSYRLDETDADYTVFAIDRVNGTGLSRISIERSETGVYDSERFARVVLTFDKPLKKERGRTEIDIQWNVDDGDARLINGWWTSGEAFFFIDRDQFDEWRKASMLSLYTFSPVGRLDSSFELKGLGRAFAGVESGVPIDRPRYALAGVNGVSNPVLIESSKVDPYYPKKARNQKLSGQVILQAVVKADGSVGELLIIRCNRPAVGFEEATKDAVRQWRYEPATKNGQPVDVYFTVVVDYSLH